MNRRSLIKSLLQITAGFLLFKNVYGEHESYLYKGKKLIVVPSDTLYNICQKKKEPRFLPKFQSNDSIIDEMKIFVDMCKEYNMKLGYEVYGCVHKDGNYSVISFSDPYICATYPCTTGVKNNRIAKLFKITNENSHLFNR
jgi:hypothetical protein